MYCAIVFVGSARRSIAKCCNKYAAISNNLYAWLHNIGGYQILRFIFTHSDTMKDTMGGLVLLQLLYTTTNEI